jgi:hypothetical protein
LVAGDHADVEDDLVGARVGQERRADAEPELVAVGDRGHRLDDDALVVVEQHEPRLGDRRQPHPRQVLIGQVQPDAAPTVVVGAPAPARRSPSDVPCTASTPASRPSSSRPIQPAPQPKRSSGCFASATAPGE